MSGPEWKKRFEEADRERQELADIFSAITSGQVDAIRSNNGGSGLLRLLDAKLVEENEYLLETLTQQSKELKLANDKLREKQLVLEKQKVDLEVAKKQLEERAKELVRHSKTDHLTGLANRLAWMECLQRSLELAKRNNHKLAVVLLDLDRFKYINDSLGHHAGDELLKTVAKRLLRCVRSPDLVARLGGDEFVLLLNDQVSPEMSLKVMQRVLEEVKRPITFGQREYTVSCSIGFSLYPQDGQDAETLLKYADTAMYQAKEGGRGCFQFYTPEIQRRIQEQLTLETELRKAVDNEEFRLVYQPQVDASSGHICGLEALIRWQHPKHGQISPDRFIPIAEEVGLISVIGEWVLRTACRQNKNWQEAGLPCIPVSVNLSAKQLLQPDIAQRVSNILNEVNLEARYLVIELTESLSMNNPEQSILLMSVFKTMGVKIAIDDFGTGYSNLSYLKQFPIDEIKIDRAFIKDITTDRHDIAIVKAIVAIAHCLDLKVVAEGIESESQAMQMALQNCDIFQGFYFYRPLTVDDCTELLQKNYLMAPNEFYSHSSAEFFR